MSEQNETLVDVNIKLAFYKHEDNGVFGHNVIKWWTNSKYYHVEMVVNNIWLSAERSGIQVHELRPLSAKYDYYEINTKLTEKQYKDLMSWIVSKKDSKYDYLGIIMSTILPARIDNPKKWFCSELVTKVLQLALVKEVYDLIPNMVTPGDLAKLFNLE